MVRFQFVLVEPKTGTTWQEAEMSFLAEVRELPGGKMSVSEGQNDCRARLGVGEIAGILTEGELFQDVQLCGGLEDSKAFPDSLPKEDLQDLLTKYRA